MKCHFMTDL